MNAWIWVLIAVVAVILIAVVVWSVFSKRRTTALRDQFGPEYDRTLQQTDSRREAETDLSARRERREQLDIRPLTTAAQKRYSSQWQQVQSRFVDQPAASLGQADELVMEVMRERGYPMDDFEQRASDISVDHPEMVEHYRAGQAVSRSAASSDATTEDMRQGLVHYRALFEELLEIDGGADRGEGAVGEPPAGEVTPT
jgi:FtsZ-interacting cell division protein ZipA